MKTLWGKLMVGKFFGKKAPEVYSRDISIPIFNLRLSPEAVPNKDFLRNYANCHVLQDGTLISGRISVLETIEADVSFDQRNNPNEIHLAGKGISSPCYVSQKLDGKYKMRATTFETDEKSTEEPRFIA